MHIFIIVISIALSNCLVASELLQRNDITTGTLSNGLRYILKSHSHPKKQISLRMHIDTGSINETDDELGLAHFLEHLAFAGSTNFPKGAEDERFSDLGIQFGAHLNAETSFTYTFYSLELPDNSEAIASCGLLFLADVLDRLTLDEATIERERPTILEEKRLNDMVPGNKLHEAWSKELLAGSLYVVRHPLGTDSKIRTLKRNDFLRYYHSFYRTDNSTLIMVGDMDPESMLKLVEEHFGSIASRPVVENSDRTIHPTKALSAYIEQGPTIKRSEVAIGRILPLPEAPRTVEEAEQAIIGRIAQMMLASRINFDAKISRETVWNLYDGIGLAVQDDTRSWEEMLKKTVRYLIQAKTYGFTKNELERAKSEYVKGLEFTAKLKFDSNAHANDLLHDVMGKKVLMGFVDRAELAKSIVERMSLKEVHTWWKAFELEPYFVKLSLPQSIEPPSKNRLLSVVKRAFKKRVSKYEPSIPSEVKAPIKGKALKAAPIVHRTKFEGSNVEAIQLENGIKMHVKQMNVPSDEVMMQITLAGGKIEETVDTNLLTNAAYKAYNFASTHLSGSDVDSIIEAKDIGIRFGIYDDYLQFNVRSNVKSIETAFQLLHVLIQDPKLSSTKFRKWKEKKAETLEHKFYTLEEWAEKTFVECAFDPREIRLSTPTDPEDIKKLKFRDCKAWLTRIFQQAPIGISVVGDINPSKVVKLARRYFGTLPARAQISEHTHADKRTLIRNPGPYVKHVVHPCEAEAAFVVGGYVTADAKGPIMNLADTIILQRLIQRARMDERLIYTVDLDFEHDDYDNGGFCLIKASCGPENQDRLIAIIDEVLLTLRNDGPTEKELAAAKKLALNSLVDFTDENILPAIWLSQLTDALWRKDTNGDIEALLITGTIPKPNYEAITTDDIKTLMHTIIKPENRIQITVKGEVPVVST